MCRLILFTAAILLIHCTGKKESSPNKFSDSTLVKIYDLQDRRQPDSLFKFLDDTNPKYRRAATLAFASLQDTNFVQELRKKLEDQDKLTRDYAAFAIGQAAGKQISETLIKRILAEQDSTVSFRLFEATGKIASRDQVNLSDNLESPFLPWLYYRYGIREHCDSALISRAAIFLSHDHNQSARLGAAHFFARGKIVQANLAESAVIQSALNDPSAEVRMASALGLKNISTKNSFDAITGLLLNDSDYRVRVNAARSLATFPFAESKDYLFTALKDSLIDVSIASAEVIRSVISKLHWNEVLEQARGAANWRVQSVLFEAAMSLDFGAFEKGSLQKELTQLYCQSSNNYQKAALLQALAHSSKSLPLIQDELLTSDIPLLQSSAATALVTMDRRNDYHRSDKRKFLEIYSAAVGRGDVAVIGIITGALTDATLGYKSIVTDIDFLKQAKESLTLPRDYESFVPLENAIAYFENRDPAAVNNEFNHPIDWALVKTIPYDQRAIIKTTKGDIIIQLLVEEAPGSVSNFIALAKKDYYDGKYFHRVVPNFVIQGGCHRGDGWGSEDYSIRSEFSGRRYKTGSVGMASAGKDTEGTQWFITHSPTPHLDGRYTIFAEVNDGMDVVHKIEVGDQILDIVLVDSSTQ